MGWAVRATLPYPVRYPDSTSPASGRGAQRLRAPRSFAFFTSPSY